VHGIGRHQSIASIAAQVQQHAKGRMIYAAADLQHVLRHDLRAPVVLRANPIAAIGSPLRPLTVATDDQIQLFGGKSARVMSTAGIDAHRLGTEQLCRIQVGQGALVVGLARIGIIFPDVSAVHTQVDQSQASLVQRVPDLANVLALRADQHAVPDIGLHIVTELAGFQIAEHIHGPLTEQAMEGVRGDRNEITHLCSFSPYPRQRC